MKPSRLFYGFDAEAVCDPQPPIEGESLLSWIGRTTLENELPNITTIMRDVGQRHRNQAADVMRMAIDVEGLATILGSDPSTVQTMRGHDLGNGYARYMGSIIRTDDVHTRARRFAPASLAKDDAPFYRASWLIRTFPVCTESWQTLRTTCDCGARQTWATVSTMVLCGACDGDLRDLDAAAIPLARQPGLKLLGDILFGAPASRGPAIDSLPTELRSLDPGEIYEIALLMARIADPTIGNPREKVWREEPFRLAMALSQAGELLHQWPATPLLTLALSGDVRAMRPRHPALKAYGRMLRLDCGQVLPISVIRLIQDIRQGIELDGPDPPADLVELNEAEKILGMNKKDIRSARGKGHLICRFAMRRGEILPGYERAELEDIASTKRWPGAYVAGKRLGLPPYAVEQLCAMGDMEWAKAPHRSLAPDLSVGLDSVIALEAAANNSACRIDDLANPVPLVTVMRGIGGREKPWGPVLRALLAGEWAYALGRNGRVVRSMVVSELDADAIRATTFDPLSWPGFAFADKLAQADACDILNVPNRDRHDLYTYKLDGNHRSWRFDRSVVAGLAERVVTSSELCSLRFLEPMAAAAVVRRARLEPQEFGLRREGAVARFDACITS